MAAIEDFLDSKHPIYEANHEAWRRNERRIRGGRPVVETELTRFIWETDTGDSYVARKRQAVYPNFELDFLTALYGHILREAPKADEIDFGSLGKVQRESGGTPTQAEQVYYNIDGTGSDGQQFYAWLLGFAVRTGATGHRWALVEAPTEAPTTRADELDGRRPYVVEFSPLAVTNWHIERGQLQWAIVRPTVRSPGIRDGKWDGGAYVRNYLLLVRQGVTSLGEEYKGGGWWEFDREKAQTGRQGDWAKTKGEIPLALLYYMADRSDDPDYPQMSQNGVDALGNLSSAYMNLESARWSDAWRAASSLIFLLGVDKDGYALVRDKMAEGSILVPVPPSPDGTIPGVQAAAAGTVTAEVFKGILSDIVDLAERMAKQQATSTPDSSGRSKMIGFASQRGPLLAVLAENLETFINSLLRFFELRFGHANPVAAIKLPRDYEVEPVNEQIAAFFDTFRTARLRSPTLEAKGVVMLAEHAGLIVDDAEKEIIRNELATSAQQAQQRAQQAGAEEDEIGAILNGTGA